MYLVYDISDNNCDINNSKFLSITDNKGDIIEICNKQSKLNSNNIGFCVVPIMAIYENFSLGYCIYADGAYNKYMAIDTNFNHINPVLIPLIRDYKINEII